MLTSTPLAAIITSETSQFTLQYFINLAVENVYTPWAADQTHSNLLAFQNAVQTAKETNGTPPTSYEVWTVNAAAVTAAYEAFTAGTPADWSTVFSKAQYTPPAAGQPLPPALPVGYPIGAQSAGAIFLALDGAAFPDGTVWPIAPATDPRGQFLKHVQITPFGASSYWTKTA